MDLALNDKRTELTQAIASLPVEQQHAVMWLIENYDTVAAICKAKALSIDERKQVIEHAEQKNNLYLLSLALLEQILNA